MEPDGAKKNVLKFRRNWRTLFFAPFGINASYQANYDNPIEAIVKKTTFFGEFKNAFAFTKNKNRVFKSNTAQKIVGKTGG